MPNRVAIVGIGQTRHTNTRRDVTLPEMINEAVRAALADAGAEPVDVDYINAHGTATQLNDRTETNVIKSVFGEAAYRIPVSASKSQLGHLIGDKGLLDLVGELQFALQPLAELPRWRFWPDLEMFTIRSSWEDDATALLFKCGPPGGHHMQQIRGDAYVKKGDVVWMPVEVPGASYGVLETQGIASVFDPLGIEYQIFDAVYDPVLSISNMTDFLTANRSKIDAMIGLGDMVTGNVKEVFDTVGIKPGDLPVVGWGNSPQTANAVKRGALDLFDDTLQIFQYNNIGGG